MRRKPLNPRDAQFADDFSAVLNDAFDRVTVNVFLCGKALSPRSGASLRSRDLRSFLRTRLESELKNCRVKLGEHKELMHLYRDIAGNAAFNLADHEFILARSIDLLVIFPCSPGSFAELGMFSREESIATKMAIFLDARFRKSRGYIVDGPVAAARLRSSKVFVLDYSKRDKIFKEISDLIVIRRALKGQQGLLKS